MGKKNKKSDFNNVFFFRFTCFYWVYWVFKFFEYG